MESGTLLLQKPSYSLCQMHFFKNDLFTFRSRKWHKNGAQNDSILSSFSDPFLDPILDPQKTGFWTKMELKRSGDFTAKLVSDRYLSAGLLLGGPLVAVAPFWEALGVFWEALGAFW